MRGFLGRCVIAAACLLLAMSGAALAELTVHFLDVGQADAAVLISGADAMLIDGGNTADSQFIFSYLRNTLGLTSLKYVVSTHPHEDHVGGLAAALNACAVQRVFSPTLAYDSKPFGDLLKYTVRQGLTLTVPQCGDTLSLGTATITILSQPEAWFGTNDQSIVLRVDEGETSFLFTGDAEYAAESSLLASGADLHADVLKVGHHGSDTSTSGQFLDAVRPAYAIISVGKGNAYGHPAQDVLDRLRASGCTILRTDLYGTIICHSDGFHVIFDTEKNPRAR